MNKTLEKVTSLYRICDLTNQDKLNREQYGSHMFFRGVVTALFWLSTGETITSVTNSLIRSIKEIVEESECQK